MVPFFSGTRPGHQVTHGRAAFELPILYFRDDLFAAFFSASSERVRAMMPSPRLHPVKLPGGRAMVAIAAFRYLETSIGPYGEVAVVVPAVFGDRPPPPILPGLLEARYPGFGAVVLHLPVTALVARDAGRGQWGYPKFVADMHFTRSPETIGVRLSEGERHILTLDVPRRGPVLRDDNPLITFSVKDGALIKTTIPQRGACRTSLLPRGATLALGEHEMAASLRALRLSSKPFMTRVYVERAGILPEGEVIERGVRPLDGVRGADREGTLTSDNLEGY